MATESKQEEEIPNPSTEVTTHSTHCTIACPLVNSVQDILEMIVGWFYHRLHNNIR